MTDCMTTLHFQLLLICLAPSPRPPNHRAMMPAQHLLSTRVECGAHRRHLWHEVVCARGGKAGGGPRHGIVGVGVVAREALLHPLLHQ